MADGPGAPEGGAPAATSAELNSSSSIESGASNTPDAATPPNENNNTGLEYADEVAGLTTEKGIDGTLKDISENGIPKTQNIHEAGMENFRKITGFDQDSPETPSPTYQSHEDTNPDNENKVHQSQAHTNPDLTRAQAAPPADDKKPVETSSAYQSQKDTNPDKDGATYQSKADTNPDRVVDQAAPPAEDKTPGEQTQKPEDKEIDAEKDESFTTPGDAENQIKQQENMQADEKTPDGEKNDEKDETPQDPKSEKAKQIEEKLQMAEIVSQIKDINPDFDPKNPEMQNFLKNLAENPDQMNTAADTLKMLGEQKTVLENSDTLKNLGINPKDLVAPAAIGTLKALSNTIEKAMNELAGKSNLTKEEKDKKEKDGILLLLLKMLGKAMGTVLVVGGTAALAAGKEMKK